MSEGTEGQRSSEEVFDMWSEWIRENFPKESQEDPSLAVAPALARAFANLRGTPLTQAEGAAQSRIELVSEVIVFCTLALLGGGLFLLLALTNMNWYYPTVFYGVVVYIAWQRYF